jgi:S1-C subfamily serine protease
MSAAQVDIRNKVAGLGGNAMVITSQYITPGQYPHGNISAEAYKCNFTAQQATPTVTGVGLILSDLSSDVKASLERNAGAVVKSVVEDSPAWKANVIPNDVLIAVNGEQVKNGSHGSLLLNTVFATTSPVQVEILRKGGTRTISIAK